MIAPLYDRQGIRIFHGDCGLLLCTLTEQVDCVISDPPYHLARYLIALEAGEERRSADIDRIWFLRLCGWYTAWMALMQRLVGNGPVWLGAGLPHAGVLTRAFAMLDWPIQDIFAVPGNDVWIYAGKRPLTPEGRWAAHQAIVRAGWSSIRSASLIDALIQATNLPKGSLILDPFCGDGSTMVAAKHRGMRGIGIEYLETRCQIAIASVEGTSRGSP